MKAARAQAASMAKAKPTLGVATANTVKANAGIPTLDGGRLLSSP